MPDPPYLQWPLFRRSVVAAFQRSLTQKSPRWCADGGGGRCHHHQSVSIALPLSSRDPCSAQVGQEERQGTSRQGRKDDGGRAEVRLGHRLRHGLRRPADNLKREGGASMKAAIYARVSTSNGSQTCENQLLELRPYCDARGWIVYAEYTDEMSGAKDRRPGLDRLLLEA